jgi:hypothetical protein
MIYGPKSPKQVPVRPTRKPRILARSDAPNRKMVRHMTSLYRKGKGDEYIERVLKIMGVIEDKIPKLQPA